MKRQTFGRCALTLAVWWTACAGAQAQLCRATGLGFEQDTETMAFFQPKSHVEGHQLFVCTDRGLYRRDLNESASDWQPAGFEGLALQDYARKGDDVLALQYSGQHEQHLLLSHDGGQTYADVTPERFAASEYETLLQLRQHPRNPSLLLLSSAQQGLFRSADFGETWQQIHTAYGYASVGFNPFNPDLIYICGSSWILSAFYLVTFDGGNTWQENAHI